MKAKLFIGKIYSKIMGFIKIFEILERDKGKRMKKKKKWMKLGSAVPIIKGVL